MNKTLKIIPAAFLPDRQAAMANVKQVISPHRWIKAGNRREEFAVDLFDRLWRRYRDRVIHVRTYERILHEAGATFVNDHIAFRTVGSQRPMLGIVLVARIFETLGYRAASTYSFPGKHVGSIYYQHPNPSFPKLFISELRTWELSERSRRTILRAVRSHRPPLNDESIAALRDFKRWSAASQARLLELLDRYFTELPWDPPQRRDVLALNQESQFAAWVLVHGYNVNHFTVLVNSHNCEALFDIEKTVAALRRAGVPMKAAIERERGSKLRQSATEAVVIDVAVWAGRKRTWMPWTYAYLELAERGEEIDIGTVRRARFEGFLDGQATNLFDMTKFKHLRG